MLEGVSIWPTVVLRIIGIILAAYFIWQAQLRLSKNLAEIAKEMKLKQPVSASSSQYVKLNMLRGLFDFSLGGGGGGEKQASLLKSRRFGMPMSIRRVFFAALSEHLFTQ